MKELKPCPFCGGEAELHKTHGIFWINCPNKKCGVGSATVTKLTEAEVATAWNTRVEQPCKACGGSGEVEETTHSRPLFGGIMKAVGTFIGKAPCPDCQPDSGKAGEEKETMTTENVDVCKCGTVMFEGDDYDTLGSESGVCCPHCGNEKFETIKAIIAQLTAANEEIDSLGRDLCKANDMCVAAKKGAGISQLQAQIKHTTDYCKALVGFGLMSISAAAGITGLPREEVEGWPLIDTSDCKTYAEKIAKAERVVKEMP